MSEPRRYGIEQEEVTLISKKRVDIHANAVSMIHLRPPLIRRRFSPMTGRGGYVPGAVR